MGAKHQMHSEARQALAALNLCKNALTEVIAELGRDFPDYWRVINLASSIAAHHKAQTGALTQFVDLLESKADQLRAEAHAAQAATSTQPSASNVVKLLRDA